MQGSCGRHRLTGVNRQRKWNSSHPVLHILVWPPLLGTGFSSDGYIFINTSNEAAASTLLQSCGDSCGQHHPPGDCVLRNKRAKAQFHMLSEPDDLCALVTFFHWADGGSQVFKIMFHLEAHGHFTFLTLWCDFDEDAHFVGFSESYNAMGRKAQY